MCFISRIRCHSIRILKSRSTLTAIKNVFFWSELLDPLSWIKTVQKKRRQFIQNGVETIRALTDINSWKLCPGTINPEDLPSKGAITLVHQQKFNQWNTRPSLIRQESGIESGIIT